MDTRIKKLSAHQQKLLDAALTVDPFLYIGYSYTQPGSGALFRKHPEFYTEFHIVDLPSGISPYQLRNWLLQADNSHVDFDKQAKAEMAASKQEELRRDTERQRETWKELGKYIRNNY